MMILQIFLFLLFLLSNFKLAMSSDKFAQLNEPLCSLKLAKGDPNKQQSSDIDDPGIVKQARRKTRNSLINFEMNKDELASFIQLLEGIQNVCFILQLFNLIKLLHNQRFNFDLNLI
jgi:hypothetical protein